MNIAIIGNLPGPISIDGPGGTETFVYNLIFELKKRGNHKITLFASNDSEFKDLLHPFVNSNVIASNTSLSPSHLNSKINAYKLKLFSEVIKLSDKFDIIHNNSYETFYFFPFSSMTKIPVVHTVHNSFLNQKDFGSFTELALPKKDKLIFVSRNAMDISYGSYKKSYVYNGININAFSFNKLSSDDMIWMSRPIKKKGLETAIKVSSMAEKSINVITAENSKDEKNYIKNIKQLYEDKKQFFNIKINISLNERVHFLQSAKVFLFPIEWEEPFGLVLIESMACGTPIIAYARGSAPEIIKDGVTGFLINPSEDEKRGDFLIKKTGIDGFFEAVKQIYSMSKKEYENVRIACRKHVEENFTIEKMVDNYEKIYAEVINEDKQTALLPKKSKTIDSDLLRRISKLYRPT